MKKSLWQAFALCCVIALSACSKQEQDTAATAEPKDVPMSAMPAEPVTMEKGSEEPAGEPTADDLADANVASVEGATDTTSEAEDDTPIAEAVEIDDEAAATATADAEVVDEEQK